MDATDGTTVASSTSTKPKRGKDQLAWGTEVWQALDQAVEDELARSRTAAKFLQQVYVHKKKVNVDSDQVIIPGANASDQALSVDETQTTKIHEYSVQFKLTPAQVEAEGSDDSGLVDQSANTSNSSSGVSSSAAAAPQHRARTAVSLSQRVANIHAQAEDLIIFGGCSAVSAAPLFTSGIVMPLDTNLKTDLDPGLLNINPDGSINLPANQIVLVHPAVLATGGAPPKYQDRLLDAIPQAIAVLQANAHYEGYAVALHTVPYADAFEALPTTLIQPVMPVTALVKSGFFGSGTLPPYVPITLNALGKTPSTPPGPNGIPEPSGLPSVAGGNLTAAKGPSFPSGTPVSVTLSADPSLFPSQPKTLPSPTVLYTGIVVGLTGNTMDLVRGQMDDGLDVAVTFNQKDANEQYRFRAAQRFALRLKDPTAVVLLLFLDC